MKASPASGISRPLGPLALVVVVGAVVAFNSSPLPKRLRIAQLRAYAEGAGTLCWADGVAVLALAGSLFAFGLAARYYRGQIRDEGRKIGGISALLELTSLALLLLAATSWLSTEAIGFRLGGGDPQKARETLILLEG